MFYSYCRQFDAYLTLPSCVSGLRVKPVTFYSFGPLQSCLLIDGNLSWSELVTWIHNKLIYLSIGIITVMYVLYSWTIVYEAISTFFTALVCGR